MENKEQEVNENMKLWDIVCKTDPAITKEAKIGAMKITAISPQHQRKKATEIFGPYGIGWGIEPGSEVFTFNTFGETTLVSYSSVMFYKLDTGIQVDGVKSPETGKLPINAVVKVAYMTQGPNGYLKVDDEYTKKVQTNALTKGLSTLGFNSDVFEGKFDDYKYVNEIKNEFAEENKTKEIEEWKKKKITSSDRQQLSELVKNMDYQNEVISEYLLKVYGFNNSTEITNSNLKVIIDDIKGNKVEAKIMGETNETNS